ncbi:MAG: putative bifunctional diguanylate cyclase/phosphodiesterase [Sulfuricaulis sp.]
MNKPNKFLGWLTDSRQVVASPMASFAVVIGLILIVGIVSLLEQERSAAAVNSLIEIASRVDDLSLESSLALAQARRAEADFYQNRNESGSTVAGFRYVSLVQSNVANIQHNMNAILALTDDPEISRLARAIERSATLYETEFLRFADRSRARGTEKDQKNTFSRFAGDIKPMLDSLRSRATIVVTVRRHRVQTMFQTTNWIIAISGIGAILLGLLVAFATSRHMIKVNSMLRLRNRALESSMNAVVIMNSTARGNSIEYVNPAFEKMTGYSAREVIGRHRDFLLGVDLDQPGLVEITSAFDQAREGHGQLHNTRKDGSLFWHDMRVAPVPDDKGKVTHFVGVMNDVTEAKNYQEQLEHQTNFDILTELPNRNLLQDRLQQSVVLAERQKHIVVVALLDLDNFSFVNNSLGRKTGDAVLKLVAQRIRSCVRLTDTVARLASDEFVLVLTGIANEENIPKVLQRVVDAISSRPQVTDTLQKVLNTVSQPITMNDRELDITCSIGVSLYPHNGKDTDTLLKNAEAAMHRAKELGRNNFQFYTAELNIRLGDRLALQTMLRRALDRGEFSLYYQPKIDIRNGCVCGAEALLRWNSPDRGMVPPIEFIDTLEDSGLIIDVGRWIIEKAVAQHAAWLESNPQAPRIAVNISQIQLAQKNFVPMIEDIVKNSGGKSCGLDMEITESLIMKDVKENITKLQAIQAMGIGIAIDDFGTGYSSFSYLAMLPINAMKIDRSFIINIVNNADHRTIVSTIISLAHLLKHKVIAEGIDSAEQAKLLQQLGCDEIQGYFFSRPIPADEFEAWQKGFTPNIDNVSVNQ